jgi:uncharacterized protein (TIGR03118 family)
VFASRIVSGLPGGVSRVAAPLLVIACIGCGGGGGYGSGGGGTAAAGGATSPSPTASLSVQPTTITAGQSATLTWSTTDASTCSATGGWSGTQATSGTQSVTPTVAGSSTFTLTCSGASGTTNASVSTTLTVAAASGYTTTKLVSDSAGLGALTSDANLINPHAIAFAPGKAAWVANNGTQTATLYDGNGKAQPNSNPLVVRLPASAAGAGFGPTGIVANVSSVDFTVSAGGHSGVARFIFAGVAGMIAGWSPTVDPNAVVAYADTGGAVYKGLALANNGTANFLFATDFHNNKIDTFDASFAKQAPTANAFAFVDPTLPAGYAPFGIQAINTSTNNIPQLYVTYAQQQGPDNRVQISGAGLGLVDVFDANGNFVKRLVSTGGALNAPWGLALAPTDFGTLSGALLVGNFGDGTINGFDPASGQFIGAVQDATGTPFAEQGLWAISFGNDAVNQPHNTLFFVAGINNLADGEYGRIDLGNAPTLNAPPVVTLSVPAGNLSGTVTLTATLTDPGNIAIANVKFFVNTTTLIGTATASPFTVQWDSTTAPGSSVTLTAVATDADGNVGTSQAVRATVGAAVTLTQLQTQVFTPLCAGCHNGSQPAGGRLPGSQDLTAGHTFSNVVGVASLEQPGLMRVKAGDPDNSYLIHKVEGAADITGAQMPFGGPPLSQDTIDQIRAWIAAGALNN